MAERVAELTQEELDDLVDRPLVRLWLYWGLFWLMVTPSVGATIAALFSYPDYLGTALELGFGRLRPMHVNGVIFGAFSTLFFGLCYSLVPRLACVRMYGGNMGYWLAWIWNLGLVAGMASLMLGYNQGLEAGELPFLVDLVIFGVFVGITVQFLMTVARRKEPQLYVAMW